jgi:gamma-glutamyl-gamma-aminobutyrate hydrolase PuuD
VEHTSHPWCIGVQWHPEMQVAESAQQDMFAALVRVARAKGVQGRGPTG